MAVSRALCFLVSVTVAVTQIFFSYSILISKLKPLILHGTPFLVLSSYWLDVPVFQHMPTWVWGGTFIGEVETQEGLNWGCHCLLSCNCIKTGHMLSGHQL